MILPLLLAATLAAQQFDESVTVHVIDVDVIATDRRGNPIAGLTKADFELYENGVRKELTHFAEVRGTKRVAAADEEEEEVPEQAARALAIFIDNSSLTQKVHKELMNALRQKARDLTSDGVAVMVAVWTNRLEIHCGLTTDGDEVVKALDAYANDERLANDRHARFQRRAAAGDVASLGQEKALQTKDWLQMERQRFFGVVAAVEALMAELPEERVKSAILFVGDGFISKGEEFEKIAQRAKVGEAVLGQPAKPPMLLEVIPDKEPDPIPSASDDRWLQSQSATEMLARIANRQGIAVYAAYGGGLAASTRDMTSTKDSFNQNLPGTASGSIGSLAIIAKSTGATSTGATNKMLPVIEQVQADLGSYYELAYTTESRSAEARKIEIRLKNNAGARLRHQQEVVLSKEGR